VISPALQRPPLVLVVDDQESLRTLIRMNLELEGIDVVEARDGAEGLVLVEQCRPDLVTLDQVMPRMDGLTAAAALRADPRTANLPIVMVTTSTAPAHLSRARSLGVDAYVSKPFEPDELVSTIRELLSLRCAHRGPSAEGAADTLNR